MYAKNSINNEIIAIRDDRKYFKFDKIQSKVLPPSFHPPAFQPRFSEKFNTIRRNIHFKISLATDQRTQKCKIPALPAHKLQPTRYWGT